MAALGDILFRGNTRWNRLAGNITTNRRYLTQTGTGVASAAPTWNTIIGTDVGGFTAGSVIFAGATGFLSEDNANLFWNASTFQLKVFSGGASTASLGVGTDGLVSIDTALVVRRANPPDIGYVAKFLSNLTSYIQIKSGTGANEQAGFSLFQATNNFEWRVAVIGNDGNTLRFSGGIGGTDVKSYITQNGNWIINDSNLDPATGTKCLIFGDGTAPSSLDANSAGLYANDVSGTVQMFAINEAGRSRQLTDEATNTLTDTGTVNDYDFGNARFVRLSNATDLTVTGLVAGYDGQLVTFYSVNTGNVFFMHADAGSSAANRLLNRLTSGPTPIAASKGSITFQYSVNQARWLLIQHEQGNWINITFNAADFTANGAMTWTVAAGDITIDQYYIVGRIMFWNFRYITTSVGGVVNTTLLRILPSTYTLAGAFDHLNYGLDNAVVANVRVTNNATTDLAFLLAAGGNWTAAANTTRVQGMLTLFIA